MNCPVCAEPLIVLEIEGVEIDHCPSCGGVWLDAGELELLLEEAANRDALMASLSENAGAGGKKVRCPICSKKLDKVSCGIDERRVVLDICPRNDGLWFDGGELRDVIGMGGFPADNRVYELINEVFGRS